MPSRMNARAPPHGRNRPRRRSAASANRQHPDRHLDLSRSEQIRQMPDWRHVNQPYTSGPGRSPLQPQGSSIPTAMPARRQNRDGYSYNQNSCDDQFGGRSAPSNNDWRSKNWRNVNWRSGTSHNDFAHYDAPYPLYTPPITPHFPQTPAPMMNQWQSHSAGPYIDQSFVDPMFTPPFFNNGMAMVPPSFPDFLMPDPSPIPDSKETPAAGSTMSTADRVKAKIYPFPDQLPKMKDAGVIHLISAPPYELSVNSVTSQVLQDTTMFAEKISDACALIPKNEDDAARRSREETGALAKEIARQCHANAMGTEPFMSP
ncbi:unnamed protein product [Periconia digitata]|uniref:Uncharacterized protein n=1 Tax=Periconia digitata TaxID=1303443 RepID=A0A9W4UF60_9PLEO|nr:unnamed protein product [Periconia digitata]